MQERRKRQRLGRSWGRGLTVITVAWLLLLGAAPSLAASGTDTGAQPLRVLVVGDSLTQGFGGDATWRYWFWREAARQGAGVDLVGPDTGFRPGYGTRYESRTLHFDRDHAAWGGATIDFQLQRIDLLVTTYEPEVVVIELGVNDALAGDSGATIADQLQDVLTRVWAWAPSTRVMVAEIPPLPGDPLGSQAAAEANALLAARFQGDTRVMLARNVTDGRLAWRPEQMTSDGIHPNAAGQTLLAERFAEAFHRGGLLAEEPHIYRSRTWSPNVVPKVRVNGRLLTVDWSASTAEVRMHGVRIRLRKGGSATFRDTPWYRVGQRRITRTLSPGVYAVQLQPRRGTMVGNPSQVVRIRVS